MLDPRPSQSADFGSEASEAPWMNIQLTIAPANQIEMIGCPAMKMTTNTAAVSIAVDAVASSRRRRLVDLKSKLRVKTDFES